MQPRLGALVPMVASLLLVASGLLVVVSAEHTQQADGKAVAFEHKTGNEWWVEVILSGPDASSVSKLEAKDDGGPWVQLEKKSWGAWGASFHIEPGHDVRFRASWADGAMVESCSFTHPEGVETCQDPWHVTEIARTGSSASANGLAVGEVEGDGTQALFVSTSQGIQVHSGDDQGWRLVDTIAPERGFGEIVVGDGDGDGRAEVYAQSDFNDLYRYVRVGDGWTESHTELEALGSSSVSDLVVGDPDDDGQDEIYVGAITDDAPVVQVRIVEGAFQEATIAEIGGGTQHLAIGDGDGEGGLELYNGGGNRGNDHVHHIDHEDGNWTTTFVDGGYGSSGTAGVAISDPDGDGSPAVFAARTGFSFEAGNGVWSSVFDGDDWVSEQIVTLEDDPNHLVAGEVDNDGGSDGPPELYVTTFGDAGNELHQVRSSDGSWQAETIATLAGDGRYVLAVGDADNDGLQDLYALERAGDGRILQVTDHAPPSTVSLTFDSRNGNEWWVQVHITGDQPSRVQAMDTGDPWKELPLRDWGDWAKSFHVEAGNDVRFRAMVDGLWHASCTFTHPEGKTLDGAETCGIEDASPPPPSDFDAAFQTPGGNEWWVEVDVDANEPLAGVDARDDGGPWIALEKKSWGAWAKSFHVEDGSLVEFRATSAEGAVDPSAEYRWPDGTRVS